MNGNLQTGYYINILLSHQSTHDCISPETRSQCFKVEAGSACVVHRTVERRSAIPEEQEERPLLPCEEEETRRCV